MRVPAAMAALVSACALAACGTRQTATTATRSQSPADQVKAKVLQLGQAASDHDYTTICEQVLAPQLITKLASTGITCRQAMQLAWGHVVDPAIAVGKVVIRGATAQAITLTTAKGEEASVDAIDLVRTPYGWRVTSLSAPIINGGR
jgi:hypothetical protein